MAEYQKQHMGEYKSSTPYLTVEECEREYGVEINRTNLGFDRGVLFDTVAIKFNCGFDCKNKVVSYLPSGSSCGKVYDAMVQLKDVA